MSESSKAFVQTLFILLTKVVQNEDLTEDEIEEIAAFLDGNVEQTTAATKPAAKATASKSVEIKYSSDEIPEGKCSFILSRGPNSGKCCSLKVNAGSTYCSRHSKDSQGAKTSTSKTTKTTKVPEPDQEKADVPKPDFKFSSLTGKKFKPVGASSDTKPATASKPETKGFFATQAEKRNPPSFLSKVKAVFLTRDVPDNDGVMIKLKYSKDPLVKNFIFLEQDGELKFAGILDEQFDIENAEDADIFENLDSENLETKITEEQAQWFVKNKVSID